MKTALITPLFLLVSCEDEPLPDYVPELTHLEAAAKRTCANLDQRPVMVVQSGQTGFIGPLEHSDYSRCMRDEANKHTPPNAGICRMAGGSIREDGCNLERLPTN